MLISARRPIHAHLQLHVREKQLRSAPEGGKHRQHHKAKYGRVEAAVAAFATTVKMAKSIEYVLSLPALHCHLSSRPTMPFDAGQRRQYLLTIGCSWMSILFKDKLTVRRTYCTRPAVRRL
jgi:hypothetical protein